MVYELPDQIYNLNKLEKKEEMKFFIKGLEKAIKETNNKNIAYPFKIEIDSNLGKKYSSYWKYSLFSSKYEIVDSVFIFGSTFNTKTVLKDLANVSRLVASGSYSDRPNDVIFYLGRNGEYKGKLYGGFHGLFTGFLDFHKNKKLHVDCVPILKFVGDYSNGLFEKSF